MNIDDIKGSPGWTSLASFFRAEQITAIAELRPQFEKTRGMTEDGGYWRHSSDQPEPELAIWWTQQLDQYPAVREVVDRFLDTYGGLFNHAVAYSVDGIVNTGLNQRCYPHVDSPHRFTEWQRDRQLKAVQCLVPLCDFSSANGATGVVDDSHRFHWSTEDAYQGYYDRFFIANAHQPRMGLGDALVYNPRLLHSTMPNYTSTERVALLISIMDRDLAQQLRELDNVWTD